VGDLAHEVTLETPAHGLRHDDVQMGLHRVLTWWIPILGPLDMREAVVARRNYGTLRVNLANLYVASVGALLA